jgi:hypothetical protein
MSLAATRSPGPALRGARPREMAFMDMEFPSSLHPFVPPSLYPSIPCSLSLRTRPLDSLTPRPIARQSLMLSHSGLSCYCLPSATWNSQLVTRNSRAARASA